MRYGFREIDKLFRTMTKEINHMIDVQGYYKADQGRWNRLKERVKGYFKRIKTGPQHKSDKKAISCEMVEPLQKALLLLF